ARRHGIGCRVLAPDSRSSATAAIAPSTHGSGIFAALASAPPAVATANVSAMRHSDRRSSPLHEIQSPSSAAKVRAPVDVQNLSGDESRLRASEPGYGGSDILRRAAVTVQR